MGSMDWTDIFTEKILPMILVISMTRSLLFLPVVDMIDVSEIARSGQVKATCCAIMPPMLAISCVGKLKAWVKVPPAGWFATG